ncbi:MAG: hypothetical protein KMY55_15210 [Dethiosulfatibacter sp.]|nr:hypothetical protein [Dethiosulfatibacter sp.]
MGYPLMIIGVISVMGILIGFFKHDRKLIKIFSIVLLIAIVLWTIGVILYSFFV